MKFVLGLLAVLVLVANVSQAGICGGLASKRAAKQAARAQAQAMSGTSCYSQERSGLFGFKRKSTEWGLLPSTQSYGNPYSTLYASPVCTSGTCYVPVLEAVPVSLPQPSQQAPVKALPEPQSSAPLPPIVTPTVMVDYKLWSDEPESGGPLVAMLDVPKDEGVKLY